MATRIEPFRDYSEHEVVNLYALEAPATFAALRDWKPGAAFSGANDAGVVVSPVISKSKLPGDLPSKDSLDRTGVLRSYLGASGQSNVGFNAYNTVEMTVAAADSDDALQGAPLGITLKQTLAYDENDENLLRYPLKKDELQAVLPGHAVPVLTRGMVLLNDSAFKGAQPAVGDKFGVSDDGSGKFLVIAVDKDDPIGTIFGTCIATDGDKKRLCKISF